MSNISDISFDIYSKTIENINNKKLNVFDYMNLIAVLMEDVSQYSSLSGPEKKTVVINVSNDIITYISKSHNDSNIKNILTPDTINNLIEVIIKAYKHRYTIKEKVNRFKKCCK